MFGNVVGQLVVSVDAIEPRLGRRPGAPPWYRSTTSRASRRFSSHGSSDPSARPFSTALGLGGVAEEVEREQPVRRDQLVGHPHQLAEHLVRWIRDPDVVAEGLAHLLHAVGPDEQRRRQRHLRLLSVLALQVPAHEQVERLVPAAELDVRLDRDRVRPLEQRVEELHDRDRLALR